MKRLAIFAHYDAQSEIKRYLTHYLEALRREVDAITFVSTSPLPASELAKLAPYCAEILLKDNVGLDFGMWQHAFARTDLAAYDELVLTNSSVFGPISPLGDAFKTMQSEPVDFWGMTDNCEMSWHLQSYFLVFHKNVFASDAWRTFWAGILPYKNKRQIVRCYEVGLSLWLTENGFRGRALVPQTSLKPHRFPRGLWKKKTQSPTNAYTPELIQRGMPFVKIELLRDNPGKVRLSTIRAAMKRAGYDMSLVEFDRPLKRRWVLP
jgi:lipopolysaccharide biosynthesis protein